MKPAAYQWGTLVLLWGGSRLKLNSRTYIQIILFPSVRGPRGEGRARCCPPSVFLCRLRPLNNQAGDAARPLPINPEWPGIHKKVDEQISLWMDSGWAADMKLPGSASYGSIPGRVQVPALDSCNYGFNQGPLAGPNICLRSLHMNTEWDITRRRRRQSESRLSCPAKDWL